jgi:kinesin family protein 15
MANMIAKNIEYTVLASESKQHKQHMQGQRVMFTDMLEGLMEEATLWKVDHDLENNAICILHEENIMSCMKKLIDDNISNNLHYYEDIVIFLAKTTLVFQNLMDNTFCIVHANPNRG